MPFSDAIKVMHHWAYFAGHTQRLNPTDVKNPTDAQIELTEIWHYDRSVASYLLTQRLPNSALMHLTTCSTAQEQSEKLTKKYQAKCAYARANLHQSFLEMRCTNKGLIQEFLPNLCYKREELAVAGVHLTENVYECTILRGISSDLATFMSHILSSALIVQSTAPINIDTLINQICEEAERLKSQRPRRKSRQQGKEATKVEVFAAKESKQGRRCKGKSRNCGEDGHWARKWGTPKREGNATAPAAQPSLGATPPPNAHHVAEAHTFLAIDSAEELCLAKEEVAHPQTPQTVDAELDLIWGHPKVPVMHAHAQLVSTEPVILLGELDCPEDDARIQDIALEPDPLLGNHNEDAHAHLASAEPEILVNGLLHQV